ncbi:oxygenase MpaB family protein [Streptomyces tauricus]|uniref:oxygenase MpaB family protein n=1 Tax=Streptomyces tauricus TaxID=68274 RepID=UPI00344A9016
MAPQLLLLQVAHPVVGAGVADHGTFRAEPWPRLVRTLLPLGTVVYGGRAAVSRRRPARAPCSAASGLCAAGRCPGCTSSSPRACSHRPSS